MIWNVRYADGRLKFCSFRFKFPSVVMHVSKWDCLLLLVHTFDAEFVYALGGFIYFILL